jgi:uncharacterized iron-regulated membrane protein
MNLRPFIFWPHLIAGVTAGSVIFLMSVTGVLLTYERQVLAWADSGYRSTPAAPGARRMSLEAVLARVRERHPDLTPATITDRAGAEAPVTISAGTRTLFVDAYSGNVLGEASRTGVRRAMATLRELHRWLAVSGAQRDMARAITGWANLIFLFIIASGFYLWFPRRWSWPSVRAVTLFKTRLSGRARDFNWHNVIGVWSAVPLFIVVLGALPISFSWANAWVYRAMGDTPPAPAAAARPAAERDASADTKALPLEGFDAAWRRAQGQVPGWRSISLRVPTSPRAPFVFTIDRGDGGQPQLRDTLTVDRRGEVVAFEPFSNQSRGRQLRGVLRFAHTGEVLGISGQTIAGIASAGGAVLVWTGLALAYRRFFGRSRQERREPRAA